MNSNANEEKWFTYGYEEKPGIRWALEVDKILHKETSPYQDILVFKR